jgi:hypothetical protein
VLYAGLGAGPNFAAAYSLTDGDVGGQLWKRPTTGNVESIALDPDGQHLFIGGHFGTAHKAQSMCQGVQGHGLAELNRTDGKFTNCPSQAPWAPHLLPDNLNFTGAWVIATTPTALWVGGLFDHICEPDGVTNCVPAQAVARFTL